MVAGDMDAATQRRRGFVAGHREPPHSSLLVEVAAVVLVVAGAAVLSTLLGRGWVVEARTTGPPAEMRRWKVRGWARSQQVVTDIAAALQAGAQPPQDPDIRAVGDHP